MYRTPEPDSVFVVTAHDLVGKPLVAYRRPQAKEGKAMKQSRFPAGWDEARVKRVLAHCEEQSEEEAVAEDEAAAEDSTQALMEVPRELVPAIRELIAKRGRTKRSTRPRPRGGSSKSAASRSGRGR